MKFYIANDHAGVAIKQQIIDYLKIKDCQVIDLGVNTQDSVDYTDYAHLLANKIIDDKNSFGILICGTGIGMSLAANKHQGIRAALCHDYYTAKMARAHNDANILCFGTRIVGIGVIESMIDVWISEKFEGGRHEVRVKKIEIK